MISTYDLQSVPHRFFKEPIIGPKKIKLAEITILKIVKSPYLDEKSSYFDEIWYTTANLELDDSQMTKYEHCFKFKMADGRHIEKSFLFGRNSAADCPISVRFCVRKQLFTEYR